MNIIKMAVEVLKMQVFRRNVLWYGIIFVLLQREKTMPRQVEREAYVSQFQGCAAGARSDERWQRMEIFLGYDAGGNLEQQVSEGGCVYSEE